MLNLRYDSKRAEEMDKDTGQSEGKECKKSEAETQRDSTCYAVRFMQFSWTSSIELKKKITVEFLEIFRKSILYVGFVWDGLTRRSYTWPRFLNKPGVSSIYKKENERKIFSALIGKTAWGNTLWRLGNYPLSFFFNFFIWHFF